MPIIKDPRQNPGNEKDYGIFYVPPDEVDQINEEQNLNLKAGHYFYEKRTNPNDFKNSRLFPHGFPITKIVVTGQNISDTLFDQYKDIFCNLHRNICHVEYDGTHQDLDDNKPMSAYHHRLISHSSPPPPGGRGLKKINQGSQYKYNRGDQTDTIGFLEEI